MKSYLKMKTRFFIQTEKSATVYIIIKKYTNFSYDRASVYLMGYLLDVYNNKIGCIEKRRKMEMGHACSRA